MNTHKRTILKPLADALTPGRKAQHTAKWARTMTRWLISWNHRTGVGWTVVDFCGAAGSESRGIVDLLAVRKDHRRERLGLKRGDLLEMVLIQVKGGSSPRPAQEDVARLKKVAKHHKARAVVLAEWKRGQRLDLFLLKGTDWRAISPEAVFG